MGELRHSLRAWRWLTIVGALLILSARLAIPAGFMPMSDGHRTLIVPCSGHGPMAMPGSHEPSPKGGQRGEAPCGFAALADLATRGADIALPGAAVAFIVARGRVPRSDPLFRTPSRLRPPLRAPPR